MRIGLRVINPLVLEFLLPRLPPYWTYLESTVVDRMYSVVIPLVRRHNFRYFSVLYVDHTRLIRTEHVEDLLNVFESDLDLHIAANSHDRLFVHAGAVRWKNHAIVIPGRSQSGKTTLVAEFLKSGAAYYSDDFATIDNAGYLHPFPRELSVRAQSDVAKKIRPDELGAGRAEPGPISLVLLTEYSEDARWSPCPVSRGRGILGLLENTPSARQQPDFALGVLQKAIAAAEVHQGCRGEKEQTVREVLNYLDRRSP